MPWVRLDDGFPEHPKLIQAGAAAGWLYVAALCYSARNLTDGHIPAAVLPRLADVKAPGRLAAKLVEARLFIEVDGGWQIHDFERYQPTRAQVEADRERARERAAKSRSTRAGMSQRTSPEVQALRATGRERSTEAVEDQEQVDARAPDREHVRLSQLLADLIRQRDPKAKAAPLSKGWLDAIRLLIDRDGRSPAEVERVIRWCQADAFWQANILSAPKLRAKFDQLAAKAGAPGRLPQPGAAEADALVVQWLDKEPEYEAMRRPA